MANNETKPHSPEPKRWGDVDYDSPLESPAAVSISSLQLYVEDLKIYEEKKINKFLDDPEDSNIQAVTSGDTPCSSTSTFEDLNMSPELLKAHNGSGKTTCFVLGMLTRFDPKLQAPQALCVCPTRELTNQNMKVLQTMGRYTGITSECAVPSTNNISIYKRPPVMTQIVIGTPGTINKWMSSKKLGAAHVKILVFDEADHMLDEDGFKDDSIRIKKDIEKISPHCQVLLFSATFNETVLYFIPKIVKNYNQLFVKKKELSLEAVKQYKVYCPDELTKVQVIKNRIFEMGENLGQRMIFVKTRDTASMWHKLLVEDGYSMTTIHGADKPEDRDKIVKEFKDGLTQVLIANNLLA